MSIEFSAVCPEQPSLDVVCRLSELMVGLTLGVEAPVTYIEDGNGVKFRLGSAVSTLLTVEAPGTHEFAGAFVLIADDRDRTPESRLLALVVVLVGAAISGGRLLDEAGLLPVTDLYEVFRTLLGGAGGEAGEVLAPLMTFGGENAT